MLTFLILFVILSLVGGILGLVFRLTFHVFKWIFLAALGVGAFAFSVLFAIPTLVILPVAAVVYLVVCLLSLIF